SLAVSANNLLTVSSPAGVPGATGYNVYVATAGGQEVLQNGPTPIALGSNWTEQATGLVTGTAAARLTRGREVLQNGPTPLPPGTTWTEPATGLLTGTAAPVSNGVGDGNLTQHTTFPGGGAAPRVTQNTYDWRDRLLASKSGVQASENDGTHRTLTVFAYDNVGELTQQSRYDGDQVTVALTPDGTGVTLTRPDGSG